LKQLLTTHHDAPQRSRAPQQYLSELKMGHFAVSGLNPSCIDGFYSTCPNVLLEKAMCRTREPRSCLNHSNVKKISIFSSTLLQLRSPNMVCEFILRSSSTLFPASGKTKCNLGIGPCLFHSLFENVNGWTGGH